MKRTNALEKPIGTSIAWLVERTKAACGLDDVPTLTLAPTTKTPETSPFADMPTYKLPFDERHVAHDKIFDATGDNPVFLRPADVKRLYGIPASTIYDWIHEQPETRFPAVKIAVKDESKRRLVLIPKRLLDEWLVDKSNLQRGLNHKDTKGTKKGKQNEGL